MSHLFHLVLRISLAVVPVFCACFVWVVFALVGCFLASREFLVISFLIKIPVVDRQCLVLARQCREKKKYI